MVKNDIKYAMVLLTIEEAQVNKLNNIVVNLKRNLHLLDGKYFFP